MDEIIKSLLTQLPTVAVLLLVGSALRQDVLSIANRLITLIEHCMDDDRSNKSV